MKNFIQPGQASFLVGGQWGSEGKGAAAAWLAEQMVNDIQIPDIVTTNAGAQAGHTHYYGDQSERPEKTVLFHMPTTAIWLHQHRRALARKRSGIEITTPLIYLNAGSILDLDVLRTEINMFQLSPSDLAIHPLATVITEANRSDPNRASSKIAGVGKGVGGALAGKIQRTQPTISSIPEFLPWVRALDLNARMRQGTSVMVEIPQGISLSINSSGFYPYTTSRECTVMGAMNDAAIHPRYYGRTLMVVRTFPIRVGNTDKGHSGSAYPGQVERTWEQIGQTPEITTVSKRVRRVFDWSPQQFEHSVALTEPDVVMVTFCNYLNNRPSTLDAILYDIKSIVPAAQVYTQWGPYNADVREFHPKGMAALQRQA